MESALGMAAQIANKSPVAVQGTKDNLNFSRWMNLCREVVMDLYTEVLVLDLIWVLMRLDQDIILTNPIIC